MHRRSLYLVLMIALAMSPLSAIEPRPAGELVGYIAVGTSPDFLGQWFQTPPERGPTLPLVKQFAVGDTAYVAFVLTGALPDQRGRADVTVDVRIAKPDGSVLFSQEAYARYDKLATTRPAFVMADPALDVGFDASDPLGEYSLVAIFHDKVAQKAALVELRITLAAKKA